MRWTYLLSASFLESLVGQRPRSNPFQGVQSGLLVSNRSPSPASIYESRSTVRCERIEIGEDDNRIARLWKDGQSSVHSGRAAVVAKVPNAVRQGVVFESECCLTLRSPLVPQKSMPIEVAVFNSHLKLFWYSHYDFQRMK